MNVDWVLMGIDWEGLVGLFDHFDGMDRMGRLHHFGMDRMELLHHLDGLDWMGLLYHFDGIG